MIIEAVKDFLMQYPALKDASIRIDDVGDIPVEYAIYPLSADPLVKEYSDGGRLMQYTFTFVSVNSLNQQDALNSQNETWFEAFLDWIEEQNLKRNLPILGNKKISQKIEVTDSGYLIFYGENKQTAKYQIQCKLTYMKER